MKELPVYDFFLLALTREKDDVILGGYSLAKTPTKLRLKNR